MFSCSRPGRARAARIAGVLVSAAAGAAVELALNRLPTHHAAHRPAVGLVFVLAAKYVLLASLMVYWILPRWIEQLRAREIPASAWARQLALMPWKRVVVGGLAVGAFSIIAGELTGLIWR